jgi:hypothetical protein
VIVMPAVKQAGRHHVQRLEVLVYQREHLLQMGQHRAGKLIDEKRAARVQDRVGLPENGLPQLGRHRGIGYSREHVIGVLQPQAGKGGVGLRRRPVDHVKPGVAEAAPQVLHEISVGFERNQDGVGPHPAQDLAGERAHPGTILHEHSSAVPIDFGENVVDQETGARDQAAEHAGVLDEVAPEEQQLSGTRGALYGHVKTLCLSSIVGAKANVAGAGAAGAAERSREMSGDG